MIRISVASVLAFFCLGSCTNQQEIPERDYYLAKNLAVIELFSDSLFFYPSAHEDRSSFELTNRACQLTPHEQIINIKQVEIISETHAGIRTYKKVDANPTNWDSLIVELYYTNRPSAIRKRVILDSGGKVYSISFKDEIKGDLSDNYKEQFMAEFGLLASNLFQFNTHEVIDHLVEYHVLTKLNGEVVVDKRGAEFSAYFRNLTRLIDNPEEFIQDR